MRSLGYGVTEHNEITGQYYAERKSLLMRMGVAGFLWIGVMLLNFAAQDRHFGGLPADLRWYVPFAVMSLAVPAVLYSAMPILKLAWLGAIHRAPRTEALLGLAILTALGYAMYEAFHGSNHIYFDVACGITVLALAEKWIERAAIEKVAKMPGDRVTSGTVNESGTLTIPATRIGEASALGKILHAVEAMLSKRSGTEGVTDRVSRLSMPLVVMFAAGLVVGSGDVLRAVSVLVIACPCALGIAEPLALAVAVGAASRRGILISDARVFGTVRKVRAVVLAKTGTITEGRFQLLEARDEDLPMIAAVERHSEHPLARAVMERLAQSGQKAKVATGIEVHKGLGISGLVGVGRLYIGSWKLFERVELEEDPQTEDGRTLVYYGWDRVLAGRLVFGDRIRQKAEEFVEELRKKKIRSIVVSGDSVAATKWACKSAGADEFRAEMSPVGKSKFVEGLQTSGLTVAMIGHGVNDAPALTTADVGIAVGGADPTMNMASVVLMTDDLGRVVQLLSLSRRTFGVVRQNLCWIFAYHAVGLVFASMGLLDPVIASSAMVLSTLCVTANALRLGSKR